MNDQHLDLFGGTSADLSQPVAQVRGRAQVEAVCDRACFTVTLVRSGPSEGRARTAVARAARAVDALLSAFDHLDPLVAHEQIRVKSTTSPVTAAAWEGYTQVTVAVRNVSGCDDLLARIGRVTGAYVDFVNYTVSDAHPAPTWVRKAAVTAAVAAARADADALGCEVVRLLWVRDVDGPTVTQPVGGEHVAPVHCTVEAAFVLTDASLPSRTPPALP